MTAVRLVNAVRDLQEACPLLEGDGGHFLIVVVERDGSFRECYGILQRDMTATDALERVFDPAAHHLFQRPKGGEA